MSANFALINHQEFNFWRDMSKHILVKDRLNVTHVIIVVYINLL